MCASCWLSVLYQTVAELCQVSLSVFVSNIERGIATIGCTANSLLGGQVVVCWFG
jgi:hypothetical protein